jgi:gliding motility-associated-like protein
MLVLLNANLIAQSVGGIASGSNSYCGIPNSGFIGLSGNMGSVIDWQLSTDNGITWANMGSTALSQSYFNLTQTTCYRAIVQLGAFPPDTSTVSCIYIYIPTVGGAVTNGTMFCGGLGAGTLNVSGSIGNPLNWQFSIDGGTTWTDIANTTNTLTYSGVSQTTIYQAIVQNSTFCAIDTSIQDTVFILPPSIAGTLSLAGNDTVCYGFNNDTINLTGNSGNVVNWLLSTDGGATFTTIPNTTTAQNTIALTQTTAYLAVVKNGPCPSDITPPVVINVLPPPAPVFAGLDTTIKSGKSAPLHGVGNGVPFWIPATGLNNPATFTPIAAPPFTTDYILTVTDTMGCLNADTVRINVDQSEFFGTISNYFTPNGDGINDSWYIQNIQYFTKSEVFVYNIYGQEVYTKKGYTNDWKGTYNGNELPDGTYYYILRFDDIKSIIKGSVDIFRKK